jgi:hypothetical protein
MKASLDYLTNGAHGSFEYPFKGTRNGTRIRTGNTLAATIGWVSVEAVAARHIVLLHAIQN